MVESADVVIVGGGIVGCATAYFLSQEGARVVIVEREALGSGASGHAPGGFGVPLHWIEPLDHANFMRQATNYYKWVGPRLAEETGIDLFWRELPWLEVAGTEATWEYMKEWSPKLREKKLVSADEVLRLDPRLGPPIYGGVVEEGNGQVDSYRLTLAFAKGAEMRGAEVSIREVTGLQRTGGRVSGVETSDGVIRCDSVVLALGAWMQKAEEWVDFPLPIAPLKGEMLYLKYEGTEYWPFFVMRYDETGGEELPILLHKRNDGQVSAGPTIEPGLFDNVATERGRNSIMARAIRLMPCIADSELVGHVGGPRPNPPDGNTVIGPIPGWEGVYMAVTLPGITCAAFMGRILSDLIYERPPLISIEPFLPKRLAEPIKRRYGWHEFVRERSI